MNGRDQWIELSFITLGHGDTWAPAVLSASLLEAAIATLIPPIGDPPKAYAPKRLIGNRRCTTFICGVAMIFKQWILDSEAIASGVSRWWTEKVKFKQRRKRVRYDKSERTYKWERPSARTVVAHGGTVKNSPASQTGPAS
jgi:hypothetical protein